MDAFSNYNQIMLEEFDQEKTLFVTNQGLFCYKVMPFGLKNVWATYQRLINKMFVWQIRKNAKVYVDDMLVKSKEEDHHLDDLRETFKTLRLYRMKLNPNKCVFGVSLGKFVWLHGIPMGCQSQPQWDLSNPRDKPPEEHQRGTKPKQKSRNTQQIRLTSYG